jgi:prophage regulatory protein
MNINAVPKAPQGADTSTVRFLRKKSVMLMTGISASGIYDLMNRGLFPKSIKLPGGKSVAWLLSDIEEWQRQVIATAKSANDD